MGFMDSKMLVLGFFILCVANAALLVVVIAPFYYALSLVVQIGESDPFTLNVDCGLFYMTTNFLSTLFLEKLDNHLFANRYLNMSQLFLITGFIGTIACNLGALLLSLKKYMTVPANIILAGLTLASTVLLIISIVMGFIPAIMGISYWSKMPSSDTTTSFGIVTMSLNWAFYIEIIGTAFALFAGVLLLVEACRSCTAIDTARQHQMREKPKKVSAADREFEKFSYARPPRRGPAAPAYTVTYQSAPRGGYDPPRGGYEPPRGGYEPPRSGYEPPRGGYEPPRGGYTPQAPPAYSKAPPSPGFIPPVQAPPSPRGGYVSRQIEI